jgi:deoxycytidylate deaminase
MKFIKLLKRLRSLSDHPQHKMACVIADKNRIVSIGFNQLKKHPRSNHPYKAIHAEVAALLGNKFADLKGTTAYIYREYKDGRLARSRPCESCMAALRLAKVKRICYTDNNTWKEESL